MIDSLRVLIARAICTAYGDSYDEQPPDLKTLREWRAREGAKDAGGTGIVRAYDPGLPTQADWLECADAALAAIEASGNCIAPSLLLEALMVIADGEGDAQTIAQQTLGECGLAARPRDVLPIESIQPRSEWATVNAAAARERDAAAKMMQDVTKHVVQKHAAKLRAKEGLADRVDEADFTDAS